MNFNAEILQFFRMLLADSTCETDALADWDLATQYGDYSKALKICKKRSMEGDSEAQNYLGSLYGTGQGVPQDLKLAFKWYSAAAEKGNASAQYNLGDMYSNGWGVPVDNVQAYAWFSVAGANGYELGQTSRDEVSTKMTPAAIEKGQQMAKEILARLGNGT